MKYLKVASGFALIVLGVAMFVTPGPGLLAVVAGVSILATEYEWARRWHDRLRSVTSRLTRRRARPAARLG